MSMAEYAPVGIYVYAVLPQQCLIPITNTYRHIFRSLGRSRPLESRDG